MAWLDFLFILRLGSEREGGGLGLKGLDNKEFLLGASKVSANLYCNSRTSVLGRLRDYLRLLMKRSVCYAYFKTCLVFSYVNMHVNLTYSTVLILILYSFYCFDSFLHLIYALYT